MQENDTWEDENGWYKIWGVSGYKSGNIHLASGWESGIGQKVKAGEKDLGIDSISNKSEDTAMRNIT